MENFNFSSFAKMYEELKRSIREPHIYKTEIGLGALSSFKQKIEDFKEDTLLNGIIWEDSGYDHELRKTEYPLEELKTYISDPKNHRMDKEDALIFSDYIWLTFLGVYKDYEANQLS